MASTTVHSPTELVSKIIKVLDEQVVPLTREAVANDNKIFGAAILSKDGLEAHTVTGNKETGSPLLHGEINCIQTFFSKPAADRPSTKDCIFFTSHEPCSLCLSGITWSGFDEFYYLFTYQDSRDLFAIPYDIDILEEVFRVRAPSDTPETLAARPLYNKTNKFFKSASLSDLVSQIAEPEERQKWAGEVDRIKAIYNSLSEEYQKRKEAGAETASVWK